MLIASRLSRLASVSLLASLLALASGCAWGGPGPEDVKISQAEYGLANDAFQRGQYRQALDHVEKALERDDTNVDAAYLGGMIMLVFCAQDETSPDCRYERAEHYLRVALAADPEMRDAKNALGVVLVHQARAPEAIEILEPLSKDMLYRSPEKAWGNLGWALLEAERIDEAIPALKRAVAAQPLFCVGHYRLGIAYEKKGEFAAARQAFTRAVSTEGGQCDRLQAAFWGRARVESKLGEQAAVRKDLEKCRDIAALTPVGKKCQAGLGKVD